MFILESLVRKRGHERNIRDQRIAFEHEALFVLAGFQSVCSAVDVVHAIEGHAGAAHADETASAQNLAIAKDIERAIAGDNIGGLNRASDSRASAPAPGESLAVDVSCSIFCGVGTTRPRGGLNGVTGGIGIGMVTFVVWSWI